MTETLSRTSPHTGTVLPEGRPFWIVDGRAYDFTEWIGQHPGGSMWFTQSVGRDISALLHTYHPEPARLQKILAKYEIGAQGQPDLPPGLTERPSPPTAKDILPKLGVPPFLLDPDFDARRDLPHLDYRDEGSLLADIRRQVHASISRKQLKKHDRVFDAVTWAIGVGHVATLVLLISGMIPAWAFVGTMVVTRTALAGAGHYHVHRKWKQTKQRQRFALPLGKSLFDINYVGTSLIGIDGHVLLHHPYLSSGADVKRTFFDAMLRLHPALRIPGHTLHKLGIALTGLSLRAREIAKFERPKVDEKSEKSGTPYVPDAVRADFWLMRAWILVEFGLCFGTGHIVAWLAQFFCTLWVNTFLVVASHDFEDSKNEHEELAAIPEPLCNDWAARQICLSYDLSVVGNRWVDLFLSAGLSPHRVHHVLPWQGSGFANLASEASVREACERAGITWERPKNLIFERFPTVIKHYLLRPVKAAPPTGELPTPPPPAMGELPSPPPPTQPPTPPRPAVRHQIGEFIRYTVGGFRGVGV